MAAPVFFSHPASLAHDTGPGHPERADRIRAIEQELGERDWLGAQRRTPSAAPREALERVHSARHIDAIEALCSGGGGWIDGDTSACGPASWEAAVHAAGGAIELVEMLTAGTASSGFAVGRPPGHHAERERAMGFCLFNTVAIAAAHAIAIAGLQRVLVLDWDVHHGNGTQEIFYSDPRVLYASIHQAPLYPGSGAAQERGAGAGEGFTANFPVPAGSGDDVFCGLVEEIAAGPAAAFEPQLVLISAGFDAHHEDPLADCEVTEAGFAQMTRTLCGLGAPVGAVLEGGYALGALARSTAATLAALTSWPWAEP